MQPANRLKPVSRRAPVSHHPQQPSRHQHHHGIQPSFAHSLPHRPPPPPYLHSSSHLQPVPRRFAAQHYRHLPPPPREASSSLYHIPSAPHQMAPQYAFPPATAARIEELLSQYATAEQERVQYAGAHAVQSQRVLQLFAQATSLARRYADRVAAVTDELMSENDAKSQVAELVEQVKLSQELYSESCRIKDLYARLHAAQVQLLNSLKAQMQQLAQGFFPQPQENATQPEGAGAATDDGASMEACKEAAPGLAIVSEPVANMSAPAVGIVTSAISQ